MAIIKARIHSKTIQQAVDEANPGDIVLICPGIYKEQVTVSKSYITIEGQNGAILDGKSSDMYGFMLQNVSGVKIKELTIRNFRFAGINIYEGSFNEIINNCIERNEDMGIKLYGTVDASIENNHIQNNGFYGVYSTASPNSRIVKNLVQKNGSGGIFIASHDSTSNIELNRIINNKTVGVANYGAGTRVAQNLINANNSGIYSLREILIEENQIHNNAETGINISGQNAVIRRNKITNSGMHGIFTNSGATNTVIKCNSILFTKRNGINLTSEQNLVLQNTVLESGGNDIQASSENNVFNANKCKKSNQSGVCQCVSTEAPGMLDPEDQHLLIKQGIDAMKKIYEQVSVENTLTTLATLLEKSIKKGMEIFSPKEEE